MYLSPITPNRSRRWSARRSIKNSTLLSLLFLLLISCEKTTYSDTVTPSLERAISMDDQVIAKRIPASVNIILGLTVDADGNTVIPTLAPPATPLYYRRTGLPVWAPDGSQVTAGEFAKVRGFAAIQCLQQGTQVRLLLSGLIPNATYRIWLLTFQAPGFDPTLPNPFVNITGNGALGPNDRSRNTFQASASGRGTIVRTLPEGPFSEFGFAGSCLPTDVFEWHIVGAFQQPGQPHGPEVGPPVTAPFSAVEQFVFVLR